MQTGWSAKELGLYLSPRVSGKNEQVEAKVLARYPPITTRDVEVRKSCTIVDVDGVVLATYIRNALSEERQVSANSEI